jgi:hypothetical protein
VHDEAAGAGTGGRADDSLRNGRIGAEDGAGRAAAAAQQQQGSGKGSDATAATDAKESGPQGHCGRGAAQSRPNDCLQCCRLVLQAAAVLPT